MKNSNPIKFIAASAASLLLIIFGTSCKKDASVTPTVTSISTITTDATTLSDVQTLSCQLPDTTNISDLPATLTSNIASTYIGYNIQFVYAIKSNGTLTGYLANLVNGTQHKDVRFDASGNYVKSLDLPAHTGFAMFQTDTIAASALPSILQTYLSANNTYAIQRRFMEVDSSYTVIATQGTSTFALLYSNTAPGALTIINLGNIDFSTPNPDLSTLPSTISDYINQNYSGATIERIIAGNCSGGTSGYTIIFKKDTAQYAAEFNATGSFMEVLQAN